MLVFLSIVGYFLKIGLGVTGSALGPAVQQGDSNLQVGAAPNEVGGGSPAQAVAAAPPAPVQRLLVELRGRLQRDPNDLPALRSLGNMYVDAGKYPQAITYYARALGLDPSNVQTRTDYASALHGAGQEQAALVQLKAVLAERPDFPQALFDEGAVAAAAGQRTLAIGAFRRFLQVAPEDQRAGDARAALQNLGA